ncbi:S8 family peptidase [Kitasatospora cheerisanensis]|uniref:S8 family peptidase n=1 Tax=Kitasatospora cheerisanensis TaxID=81942 RepID=UPI001AD7EC0C|nr:S8 family peptidase [Kitasatospora cheerisanensis]
MEGAVSGVYVEFESFPGVELAVESLDSRVGKVHPELMSVQPVETAYGLVERATVFVPDGKLQNFVKKIEEYAETADTERPTHSNLVNRIKEIRLASINALWTDPVDRLPRVDEKIWLEVWLRVRDGREIDRFREFAAQAEITLHRHILQMADRVVLLAATTLEQLSGALDVLDDLAEIRRSNHAAEVLALQPAVDQGEWVSALLERTDHAPDDAPAACILDTGVFRDHPLLRPALNAEDCHTAETPWNTQDHSGHGTEMAGLALFGDLGQALVAAERIHLRHRLESAKILPPPPAFNEPDVYGLVVAKAVDRVEIQAPRRRRVFSMAVTAGHDTPNGESVSNYGQPTSWSSAIDALAYGHSIDSATDSGQVVIRTQEAEAHPRLFVVSAGNIFPFDLDHLTRSDVEPVEDPAQAWNVLTVGAFTERDDMSEAPAGFNGWRPLAPRGELSPHSRTSVAFSRTWPVKPEVVFEGGNAAASPDDLMIDTPENLQVLTTQAPVQRPGQLGLTAGTSAATAQAANMAAQIMCSYPSLWPETVRALIIHSAEWTSAMRSRITAEKKKVDRAALLRRYGMGVPDVGRATRSASNALTLVAQETIHPFNGAGALREIHMHDLPWPVEVLMGMGETPVRLRVTLAYFIDPNPGRRGWRRRYTYASHGLRFDMRRATESNSDFRKRINRKALAEEEARPESHAESGEWFFGAKLQQSPGSVHTDIWQGTAADLASRGAIAVYPVTGWWKENPKKDRSPDGARYSLVISIDTPSEDVDIWTPVAQQIGVPITIS